MNDHKTTGMTGEICTVSGVYSCVTIAHGEVTVSAGSPFPVCYYGDGHDTVWVLRRELPNSGEED